MMYTQRTKSSQLKSIWLNIWFLSLLFQSFFFYLFFFFTAFHTNQPSPHTKDTHSEHTATSVVVFHKASEKVQTSCGADKKGFSVTTRGEKKGINSIWSLRGKTGTLGVVPSFSRLCLLPTCAYNSEVLERLETSHLSLHLRWPWYSESGYKDTERAKWQREPDRLSLTRPRHLRLSPSLPHAHWQRLQTQN